ncbi:TPA: DUF551 domain-containing protein [Salmonella enterica subsp. enterica]|uniref:DUF551 domain-containing protein n=1 Tax=Salmonella enterica TaxID=28901 RepID=UPI0027E50439|nr:DUF551 domain-containing protein [Salmonella enterica]MDQ7611855.1 DUF551 domain-containing protein [Salmonella enterica subsp. enterica serovar Agona]
MTTITKEWLQQTIAEFENTRDDIPFGLSDDDAKILIVLKRALASLDAEPVGYFYADKPGDWYQISDGDRVPGHRLIPLYASPQSSPAVKLPNEFISSEGIVVQIEKLMVVLAVHGIQYERKGSSCRVDILQAGNSPVTPDGWISCSERMPDDEQEVIVHNKLGYRYVSYFDEHSGLFFDMRGGNQMNCIEHILVTHWMPLPAAPEPDQS